MGAWAYCQNCRAPMRKISIEDISDSLYYKQKITCENCGEERHDNDPEEYISILFHELVEFMKTTDDSLTDLREEVERLERKIDNKGGELW